MTKLSTREVTDSVMLMNMIGATRNDGSKTFERILATVRERQERNPSDSQPYDVEVKVNGIEVDFRDFAQSCVDQLDGMVLRAAKELLAESDVIGEMDSTLYDIQEQLKSYAESVKNRLAAEWSR